MKKYFSKSLVLSVFVVLPSFAFAAIGSGACGGVSQDANGILCRISALLNNVLPVLVALGIVYFVYGVVTYMIGDDEEAKTRGRDKIVFGVIGLAVILCVWGLVYVLINTFGVGRSGAPEDFNGLLPGMQSSSSSSSSSTTTIPPFDDTEE
jgi:hypothetical protein